MQGSFLPPDATPRACRLRLNEIEAWVRRHGYRFPPRAQVLLRSLLEEAASTPLHVNALIEWLRALYDEVVTPRATSSSPDGPSEGTL